MTFDAAPILAIILIAIAVSIPWATRHMRARSLERALYAEIVSMRVQAAAFAEELARRHDRGQAFDGDFFRQWRLSPPLIYPSAGTDLGLLAGEALDRVGYFHAQLAEARRRVATGEATGQIGSAYRLLSNLVRAVNHIAPWIGQLERRHGKWPMSAAELSGANRLLETLEESADPVADPWCWSDTCYPARADERGE